MSQFNNYILSFFILFPVEIYAQQPIELTKTGEKEIIKGFTYLVDTSKSLQIENINSLYKNNKFNSLSKNTFEPGFNVYWLHFYLKNATGFDQEFVLDLQNWSYIEAHITGDTIPHKTGHLFPFQKRNYQVANKAYILLPIKREEIKELFVRIESKYNNELTPKKLSFKTATKPVIDKENDLKGKMFYSFTAVFLVMFLYNSFIYLSTHLKSYAYYLIVLLLTFYTTAYNSGYIIELFGIIDIFPIWITYFERFSATLLGMSVLLFTNEFLRVRDRYPSWHKIIKYIFVIYVAVQIVWLYNEEIGMLLSLIPGLATIISIILLAIKSIRDKFPSAKYFLIGYSAFLIGVMVIILSFFGVLPKNDWTFSFSLPIGSTIEIVVFSFALANMINVLRKENEDNWTRQQVYIREKADMKLAFQQELLKTQLEIKEQTFYEVSKEIHDNIGQILSLIRLNISTIDPDKYTSAEVKIANSKELIDKVIQDLRDLSKTLNADFISEIGLINALEQQLQTLNKTGLYTATLSVKGDVSKYEMQRELFLYRIIQELLNNIVKHAEASIIHVTMEYCIEKLVITVHDNGKGFNFDPQKMSFHHNGLGLRNMYNRLMLINGSLQFNNQPQKGTVAIIELLK